MKDQQSCEPVTIISSKFQIKLFCPTITSLFPLVTSESNIMMRSIIAFAFNIGSLGAFSQN